MNIEILKWLTTLTTTAPDHDVPVTLDQSNQDLFINTKITSLRLVIHKIYLFTIDTGGQHRQMCSWGLGHVEYFSIVAKNIYDKFGAVTSSVEARKNLIIQKIGSQH